MRWSRILLLSGPYPQNLLPIQLLSHPTAMDKLIFLLQCPFLQLPLLLPPYLHHLFKALLRIFHHFSFPLTTSSSSSISLSSPPSYSDSLSSLTFHTFSDQPVSSLSYTLTSYVPSSFPPSYPIHRPTPIYTYSRPSSFSVGSIPYLYSSVLSTNTLSLSYHGSSSTRVSSASSGPAPVVPREGPPVAEPETGSGAVPETLPITLPGDKVSGLSLLAAPFPCFPPGPTLPVTGIIP